jgi:hypothetical protein
MSSLPGLPGNPFRDGNDRHKRYGMDARIKSGHDDKS